MGVMRSSPTPSDSSSSQQLLHAFLTRAAERWPHRVALDVPPGRLRPSPTTVSYAELARQSDALAHRLGPWVQRECVFGILLPRHSPQLFIAQLAVLKAGAAYTCLDPAFPDERIRDVLEDAAAVLLLSDAPGQARVRGCGLDALPMIGPGTTNGAAGRGATSEAELDSIREPDDPVFSMPCPAWLQPASLACVIYTSGTTSKPKGVMIEHRSFANLVAGDLEAFGLAPGDRVAQGSSATYDSAIEETWLAFASAATLVLLDDDSVRLGPDLVTWLQQEGAFFQGDSRTFTAQR